MLFSPTFSFFPGPQRSVFLSATAQSILDECVLKWTGAVDPGLTGIWDQETFCAVSVRESETDGEKRREEQKIEEERERHKVRDEGKREREIFRRNRSPSVRQSNHGPSQTSSIITIWL